MNGHSATVFAFAEECGKAARQAFHFSGQTVGGIGVPGYYVRAGHTCYMKPEIGRFANLYTEPIIVSCCFTNEYHPAVLQFIGAQALIVQGESPITPAGSSSETASSLSATI